MKNLWAVMASLPPIIVFAFSTFAIGAHLVEPGTPPPSLGVYIAALVSFALLLVALFINRRRELRRIEERSVLAARRQISSP
ncbi:Uncharacterised protein [Mycobacteroides abscessus subsp. bolletii]|uniref:hypothetical protein n=1 Tax=Mycobacteroides abscessus TaxID=36809 RepID=UPI0009CD58AE|nr:hypothetical protein [Mycobacteroides abscessus]SKY97941.1 Uncharacterised protein [Mycobacteroides abscessus subsp. bolletii]